MSQNEPGTMAGIDTPDDSSGVAEDTQGTDWDLTRMSAAHLEGSEYRILSTRNDSVNHYRVNVREGTCSCPSEKYNLNDNEACPHLAKALVCHTSHLDGGEWAIRDLQTVTDRANTLIHDLRETTDWVTSVIESEAASGASQTVRENGEATTPDGSTVERVDATDAADTLQEAFDEQTSGMEAIAHDGKVWPNNTPDAPDWTFDAFIKNKEQIQWDADGDYDHPTVGPNDYELENYIEPSDVDEYISEVLE